MECMVIQGGRRLTGEVRVSGAKNAALPILAATLLGKGTCTLTNIPAVRDVVTMSKVLTHLGARVEAEGGRYTVSLDTITSREAPYDLVRTMRASVMVLGPLVARWGEAVVALATGHLSGDVLGPQQTSGAPFRWKPRTYPGQRTGESRGAAYPGMKGDHPAQVVVRHRA